MLVPTGEMTAAQSRPPMNQLKYLEMQSGTSLKKNGLSLKNTYDTNIAAFSTSPFPTALF
ncbi:hypothetical protein U2W12_16835 [Methylomicrobium sp. Wu6]|nr:hypothetical protein [Methylomicrobium sp. Wu6]